MAPSPELGQPKAPDKAGDEQQKLASGSGDTTDRTSGGGSSSTTGTTGSETRDRTATAATQNTSNPTNTTINSHGGCSSKSGPTPEMIALTPVISTMAISAATTMTTTTPATSVKVSSSSSTTPTAAAPATTSSAHGKNAESSKSSAAGSGNNNKDSHFQTSAQEPLATMNEDALKALLDEAITYKCPKDREHKSATFNELLSKTEREDQEQNFSFASRPVLSKRASARPTQGGSLQDITEATKQEYGYTEYGSSLANKRHGGGGHGGSRSKRQVSSVSSRQREGGSLPSNVNESTTPSYISEQPFLNEVRRPLKSTSVKLSSAKTNDYGALLQSAPLNAIAGNDWSRGEESHLGKGNGDTGTASSGVGSHSVAGGTGGSGALGHTVINMGELDSDEPSVLSGHASNALQQSNNYETNVDDIELMAMGSSASTNSTGGAGSGLVSGSVGNTSGVSSTSSVMYGGPDAFGNGTGGASSSNSSNSSSSSCAGGPGGMAAGSTGGTTGSLSSAKKSFCLPKQQYTTQASLEISQPCNVTRPASVHHVDKTVSLPMLEAVQLGSTYPAVKCMIDSSKVDQSTIKSVLSSNNQFISTTRSSLTYPTIQQKFDENANSVPQFGATSGGTLTSTASGSGQLGGTSGTGGGGLGLGGGKKLRKPKSDRNTVVVVPENIAGYRGQFEIEALVSYIENDDSEKQTKQSSQQHQSSARSGGSNSAATGGGGGSNGSGGGGGGGIGSSGMKIARVQSGGGGGYASVGNGNATSGVGAVVSGTTTENGKEEERGKRKNEKKRERAAAAKMKKSNSLEELSSCSRKKVEEENTRQNHIEKARAQETDPAVTLRSSKSKKSQSTANANTASSSAGTANSSSNLTGKGGDGGGGKRSERRSWGTEELTFLGNDMGSTIPLEAVEALVSSSSSTTAGGSGKGKKDKKEQTTNVSNAAGGRNASSSTASLGDATSTQSSMKKRDSLRMSVESLSAVGGGSGAGAGGGGGESSDFHVVTKKKKAKKKIQNLGQEESNPTVVMAGQNSSIGQNRRYPTTGGAAGGATYGRNSNNSNNSGSSVGAASAAGGRYQASNHFTADREVYMNNDVSRRKSTSSVPPSDKSDSSDADSVHSLPIETNAARKQQQKQQAKKQTSSSHQQQSSTTSQQRQGGASQSYAEIARIPNAPADKHGASSNGVAMMATGVDGGLMDGSNSNHPHGTGGNGSTSNQVQDLNSSVAFPQLVETHHHEATVTSASASGVSTLLSTSSASGPSLHPSQLSSTSGNVVYNASVSSNNTGSNNAGNTNSMVGTRATYSQSLLTAVNNVAEEKSNVPVPAHYQQQGHGTAAMSTSTAIIESREVQSGGAVNGGVTPVCGCGRGVTDEKSILKSKSVENTDLYYSNEHYPALEKTVKPHHQRGNNSSGDGGIITGAGGKNVPPKGGAPLVLAAGIPSGATSTTCASIGGGAGSLVHGTTTTGSNAGSVTGGANPAAPKKGKSKKETSVTTAPPPQVDAANETQGNTMMYNQNSTVLIDTDTQTATMLPFDTRSPMNGGGVVNTIHFLQTSPQSQPSGQPSTTTATTATTAGGSKRHKKDKSSSVTAGGKAMTTGGGKGHNQQQQQQQQQHSHRPAVIILNDNEPKSNEFTFGFDIDQELLFGDFSEEDRGLLDGRCTIGGCSEHQNPKAKQQRSRNTSNAAGGNAGGNSSDNSNLPQSEQHEMSPSASSLNDGRDNGKGSSSSASSSVSSSSVSLSSTGAGATSHSYQQQQQQPSLPMPHLQQQQPVAAAILMAPAIPSDVQRQSDDLTTVVNTATIPADAAATVTMNFHQPPPAVLLHGMYTQPPPTLPPAPHHLLASPTQPQHVAGPAGTRQPPPARHHNSYPMPPPNLLAPTAAAAVVPAASTGVPIATDSNGNPTAPTAVAPTVVAVPTTHLITVPPPTLPRIATIVPSYGVLLPPGAATGPVPAAVTVPPVATAAIAPLVVPVAVQQTPAAVATLVGKGTIASSSDAINKNSPATNSHHHHQQHLRQSSPATVAVVTPATNINSISHSYQQQQLLLQQQQQQQQLSTQAPAQVPTVVQVTTVDTAAQTHHQPAMVQQQQSSSATEANVQSTSQPKVAPVREKMKEINLRFIAPEQVNISEYNHDKIVFFVGTAWEDAICGNNGTAKYYEDQ